jgi:arginyl-tRNA synthetase
MKDLIETIKKNFRQALSECYGAQIDGIDPAIVAASNPTFGDFQCNVALTLSKQLKSPPRQIAENIVKAANLSTICEPLEIAGPGFINIRIKKAHIEGQLNAIKLDQRVGVALAQPPKKIIVELSSPNMAKEMHVGHLRSTIIGDCLARVLQFLGHDVLRLNHIGDWGTQFGMLLAYLKEACPQALQENDSVSLGDLVTFYRQAKKRFDADPAFQDLARLEVVRLQAGDKESLRAWGLLLEMSRRDNQVIYDMLDVKDLVERGESFYNPELANVVKDLQACGIAVESEGAQCVFVEGFFNEQGNPLPLIIQKKDGGYNYGTTDLAALRYRVNVDKVDEIIYVVDAGQSDHFQQVFAAANMAQWVPSSIRVEHVPFGVVQGEDGKKLKTRSGETIRLQDLLDEAIVRARKELDDRLAKEGRQESEEFKQEVARAIGIGAVKYADLSLNRITNYVFSYDRMLSLSGNTAPYMMYAYVRVRGIARKGEIDFEKLGDNARVILSEPTESELAKHLLKFDEVLESVAQDLLPNRICEYLFELSQKFNQFYESCQVLNAEAETRTSRLILCDLTARTIKIGLSLLGIAVLERM